MLALHYADADSLLQFRTCMLRQESLRSVLTLLQVLQSAIFRAVLCYLNL